VTRVDVVAYSPSEVIEEAHVTLERCVELTEKYPATWVDIVDLDPKDSANLERLFALHPLALEDSLEPQLARLDEYDNELFLITKVIDWRDEIIPDQLSIFLSKKFVITIHGTELPQVNEVKQRVRKASPRLLKGGPDYLCLNILDAVVDSYTPILDRLGDFMDELEEAVVDHPHKDILNQIHRARRSVLQLRKEISPQREALHSLWRAELPYVKKETRSYIRDVYDHVVQFLEYLETYRELTADVYEIYLSTVQLNLNEVIRFLTVTGTIMLTLALIASLWGMNFALLPLAGDPWGFWYMVLSMVGLTGGLALYFHRRGWI
jgi:magnesium transporter